MPIRLPSLLLILLTVFALALYEYVRYRRINQNPQSPAVKSRRQQALAASIMETIVEGVITTDDAGRVQSFNAAAERMFDYFAEEVIGQNLALLMPALYEAQLDHYIANCLTSGARKIIGQRQQLSGLRKNGEEFPIELVISEVIVDGERSFASVVRDVSERCRFIAEIEASQRQLRQIIDLVPPREYSGGRALLMGQMVDLTERLASEQRVREVEARLAQASQLAALGEMAAGLAHDVN